MEYDDVYRVIGSFGRYQKFIYVLQTLPVVFTAIQTYLSVFILYVPDHRCASPNINATTMQMEGVNLDVKTLNSTLMYSKCEIYQHNFTMASLHQAFDPMTENYYPHNDDTTKPLHMNYISLVTNVTECNRWEYDTTEFETTFITQDNLVCSKKFYRTYAIVVFMLGFTLGSLGIGLISDRLGRKFSLMASILLYIGSNIPLSFVNKFEEFTTLRFFSGVSVGGLLSTCYVMDLEFVAQGHKMLAGNVLMFFWGFGALLLTGIAYFIRDWRYLNFYLAIPTVLFIFYIKIVPESTRWLVVKGKREKAEKILRLIARRNKMTFEEPILPCEEGEAHVKQIGTFRALRELCSHRRLVCQTAVLLFNWFVVALVFLGLSWNVNYLKGDVFLNFFLTSVAEIVGFIFCTVLLHFIGRKPVYFISLLVGGVPLVLTIFPILYGSSDMQLMMFLLSLVGKVGTSAAFATLFLYSSEFFPTVLRNFGLGIANFCARTGGMVAPFVPDLSQLVGGDLGRVLPMIIFGGLTVLAGGLSFLLPETGGQSLPENVQDVVDRFNGQGIRGTEMIKMPSSTEQAENGANVGMLNGGNVGVDREDQA